MSETKCLGILQISSSLLLRALRLPPDTVIQDVQMQFERGDIVEFRILHPDLPILEEGKRIPRVTAEFQTLPDQEIVFTRWIR